MLLLVLVLVLSNAVLVLVLDPNSLFRSRFGSDVIETVEVEQKCPDSSTSTGLRPEYEDGGKHENGTRKISTQDR